MPKKSRRNKVLQSRRKQERQSPVTTAVQPPAVTQPQRTGASPSLSSPSTKEPAPRAQPKSAPYPYVSAELRNIGFLFGVILVILIVLALVLP